mgnify:CR=1 FL=1
MKITDKLILRCMRHTFIWAWDASIMYAAYHLQHFLPPILFTLIMAVGGCIFIIYFLSLIGIFLCLLCNFLLLYDNDSFEEKEKDKN